MTPHDPPDEFRPASGWRGRLPFAAFTFVILALLAQAIMPPLLVREVADVLTENNRTFEPARRRVRDLNYLFEHQVAEMRALIFTGDRMFLDSYREARVREEQTLQRLEPLVGRIGPEAVRRFERVRRYASLWHEVDDQVAAGTIAVEDYTQFVERQSLLNDSLAIATEQLNQEIDRAAITYFAGLRRQLQRQLTASTLFTALALVSAALVGWFWWRQYKLARQIAVAAEEERRLRAEAERRREEIVRITESRARLMRGFSHDVKNPLGAADGYLQLLEDGVLGPVQERQKESIGRARRAIAAAMNLIEDLLALARTETGEVDVVTGTVDLRTVARDAADQYRAQAEAKGIRMIVDVPSEPLMATTDERRVRQILGNLLSNAVKYTDHGSITVWASLRDDGPTPGTSIALGVTDTGRGIPRDQIPYLFREYSRLRTAAGEAGNGLGLAISRRIAHAIGGEITVESEVGRGSTFTLWLPVE